MQYITDEAMYAMIGVVVLIMALQKLRDVLMDKVQSKFKNDPSLARYSESARRQALSGKSKEADGKVPEFDADAGTLGAILYEMWDDDQEEEDWTIWRMPVEEDKPEENAPKGGQTEDAAPEEKL